VGFRQKKWNLAGDVSIVGARELYKGLGVLGMNGEWLKLEKSA